MTDGTIPQFDNGAPTLAEIRAALVGLSASDMRELLRGLPAATIVRCHFHIPLVAGKWEYLSHGAERELWPYDRVHVYRCNGKWSHNRVSCDRILFDTREAAMADCDLRLREQGVVFDE